MNGITPIVSSYVVVRYREPVRVKSFSPKAPTATQLKYTILLMISEFTDPGRQHHVNAAGDSLLARDGVATPAARHGVARATITRPAILTLRKIFYCHPILFCNI
jgi:hypothetical protein